MNTKTRVVRVFTFILALTLVFASFTSPAYALSKQQFSAWVAAALQAINITATAQGMAVADASRNLMDYLATPYRVVLNQFVDVPYTTPVENIDQYMERSVLKIDKDVVTIDGVEYTDVWISTDAAEKFRVNAFDLENAFDIASQSEGTFVSGSGTIGGVPIFNVNNELRTHGYKIPYNTGIYNAGLADVNVTDIGNNYSKYAIKPFGDSSYADVAQNTHNNWPLFLYTRYNTISQRLYYLGKWNTSSNYNQITWRNISAEDVDLTPFDFDWVSGDIPANKQLEDGEGLVIRVPTDDIQQWYNENPEIGSNVTINLGDPELSAKVDDLIDLIIPIIPVLDIEFKQYENPQPVPEPVPDPQPYPDPLPDPSIELIDSTLKDIIQALKNIFDNISINNSYNIAIKNIMDAVKWNIDIATDQISSIASGINQIIQNIESLANKIVTGNADWFSDIVDAIRVPFLPWLNIFKAATGIWHYVVSWVQNISGPFSYFWNILGSVNPVFYSPIYAVAAATIVIAIYRRFGR